MLLKSGTRREINNKDYFDALRKERLTADILLEKTLAIPSEKIDNVVFKNNKDLFLLFIFNLLNIKTRLLFSINNLVFSNL